MNYVEVLGVQVHTVSVDQLSSTVRDWVGGEVCRLIFTPNPEMLVEAQGNAPFMSALGASDINVADGTGLVLAARLRGQQLRRLPGVDVALQIVSLAAMEGWRVFLLGGGRGVAALAAQNLAAAHPGLDIEAAKVPLLVDRSGESSASAEAVAEIAQYRPQVVLVALGAPKQELWLTRHRAALAQAGVRVAMGVGGTFDYWAGTVRRAPRWMSKLGIEWLWRLLLQPKRFGRIVRATAVFCWLVVKQKASRG